jgi:hypothetical protein
VAAAKIPTPRRPAPAAAPRAPSCSRLQRGAPDAPDALRQLQQQYRHLLETCSVIGVLAVDSDAVSCFKAM